MHLLRAAASRTFWTAGSNRPIRIAIIAITTSSSISVKAPPRRAGRNRGNMRYLPRIGKRITTDASRDRGDFQSLFRQFDVVCPGRDGHLPADRDQFLVGPALAATAGDASQKPGQDGDRNCADLPYCAHHVNPTPRWEKTSAGQGQSCGAG